MNKLLSIIVVISCLQMITCFKYPEPTGKYMNNKELIKDKYNLHWNTTEDAIIFEIAVKHTDGYVAFGLSPTGGMENSDIVVAWMDDNGITNFTDRFIYSKSKLSIDVNQNWYLLNSYKEDGFFVVKFWRKLILCDDEDIDIVEGKQIVIFSYGNQKDNTDIIYHGKNRGAKNLHFIGTLNQDIQLDMSEIETFTVMHNSTMHFGAETDYHCELFKFPNSWQEKKRHLVRYETIPQVGNEQHFHHVLMYECQADFEEVYIKKFGIPEPGSCYNFMPEMAESAKRWGVVQGLCNRISLVWAVGGDYVVDMPEGMAYPLGGKGEFSWFFLEVHFTNDQYKTKQVIDYSGMKLYVTENYRPIELGITSFGSVVNWESTSMPPGADKMRMEYYCPNECLDKLTDRGDEITIIGSLAHSHLAGREMYSKIVRDNKEIEYITNNKNYDSEYQNYKWLTKPFVLKKGDEVKTTCVYSTKDRPGYTVGGFSTFEEMCLDFFWYYPAGKKLSSCWGAYDYTDYYYFLLGLNATNEIRLTPDNGDYYDKVRDDILNQDLNYYASPETIKKFQEYHVKGKKNAICNYDEEFSLTPYGEIKNEPIEENDPCQK